MTGADPASHASGRTDPVVVFDIGNVLLRWDPRHLYARIFPNPSDMEWFLSEICTPAWNLELDRGRAFAPAVEELAARHPEWTEAIRAFDTRWHEMVPGSIPENVALLERIRARGQPVYAITNFSREKFTEACERFPFLTLFDGVVVSAHEGLIKPDPAIFRLFLERYGLAAEACIFIDDSAANIAAAREIGMTTIHFVDGVDVGQELARLGMRL